MKRRVILSVFLLTSLAPQIAFSSDKKSVLETTREGLASLEKAKTKNVKNTKANTPNASIPGTTDITENVDHLVPAVALEAVIATQPAAVTAPLTNNALQQQIDETVQKGNSSNADTENAATALTVLPVDRNNNSSSVVALVTTENNKNNANTDNTDTNNNEKEEKSTATVVVAQTNNEAANTIAATAVVAAATVTAKEKAAKDTTFATLPTNKITQDRIKKHAQQNAAVACQATNFFSAEAERIKKIATPITEIPTTKDRWTALQREALDRVEYIKRIFFEVGETSPVSTKRKDAQKFASEYKRKKRNSFSSINTVLQQTEDTDLSAAKSEALSNINISYLSAIADANKITQDRRKFINTTETGAALAAGIANWTGYSFSKQDTLLEAKALELLKKKTKQTTSFADRIDARNSADESGIVIVTKTRPNGLQYDTNGAVLPADTNHFKLSPTELELLVEEIRLDEQKQVQLAQKRAALQSKKVK